MLHVLRVLPVVTLAIVAAAFTNVAEPLSATSAVNGNYIVVLRDGVDVPAAAGASARRYQISVRHVYTHALNGYAFRGSAAAARAIARNANVAFVSRDRRVRAGGTVPIAASDSAPAGVRRIDASTTTTAHQASITNVAVIDTGVSLSHPDLNAAAGKNCIRPGKPPEDDNGHGSHVAGTIGARNNGAGVVGVAPNTKVYAVKVLNAAGSGTWSQVICGIDWVTANASALNIKVANMSLGGGGSNDNNCGNSNADALHRAICNATSAGVTFVVAAGNSGANLAASVPAAYPEVLTVTAASDSDGLPGGLGGAPTCRTGEADDAAATFSNYAAADNGHTVAAPGVCIRSTWKSRGYNTISGTSMASPHVAGLVALCIGNGGAAGPCAGLAPAAIIVQVRGDAAAHATAANGFAGDPNAPVSGRYYGYLVWAGGY